VAAGVLVVGKIRNVAADPGTGKNLENGAPIAITVTVY